MSVPTAFGAQIYFHSTALTSRSNESKKLNNVRNAVNSTLVGMAVQLMQKDWDVITRSCSFGRLRIVINLYLSFNSEAMRFQVFSRRSDGFMLLIQQENGLKRGHLCRQLMRWTQPAETGLQKLKRRFYFLSYWMLKNVSKAVSNYALYNFCDE